MTSLDALLEAAKYLEMQEQQNKQTHEMNALSSTTPPNTPTSPKSTNQRPSPHPVALTQKVNDQTVIITPLPPPHLGFPTKKPDGATRRILHNSFDIMNPLVIDETNGSLVEQRRKQPPMAFRAGTREVHNKLEKHRRAHLKECFDILKKQLPSQQDDKKTSNLNILHSALKYIQLLKRKERELEHEMERLARDKITAQQRLATLKKDIQMHYDNVDFNKILPEIATTVSPTKDTNPSPNLMVENERTSVPILPNNKAISSSSQVKEMAAATPVQTTALSVLPVGYPVSQGLVLQKLIVPKAITDLPIMSTHFITQQQLNGKVVPLVNAQYVVKPVVVVSRPS